MMGYNGKKDNNKTAHTKKSRKSTQKSSKQGGSSPTLDFNTKPVMSSNHMDWYNSNPRLVEDSARINFTRPLGSIINEASQNGEFSFQGSYNPGIATFRTMLIPGYSDGPTSAVNIAARDIYSFVRHENSGKTNYDATQLMFYLLAVDQLHAWHEYLKRAYGVIRNYDQRTKYTPKALLQAMGIDYDDIINHAADFRWLINATADRASIFHVPNGQRVPLLERHKFMYSSMYYDRDIEHKAQIYMFVPDGYFWWSETQKPFELTYNRFPNALGMSDDLMTLSDLRDHTENMLGALVESEDAQIISGDVYKAYGQGNLLTWDQMDENYVVYPSYDVGMLTQIHNMSWLDTAPKELSQDGLNTPQDIRIWDNIDANSVMFTPVVETAWRPINDIKHRIVNLPFSYPNSEDVMRATRLMFLCKQNSDTSGIYMDINCIGTELITRVNIFTAQIDGSFRIDQVDYTFDATRSVRSVFDDISKLTQFDWFPLYNVKVGTDSNTSIDTIQPYFGERQNWTLIDADVLNDINHTAIMSEFGVPIL